MARQYTSTLMLVSFFAIILVGLNGADAAAAGTSALTGVREYASAVATTVREKIFEFAAASAEDGGMLPLVIVGAVAAMVAAFTLYLLSLFFDKDPFLFNGGKMGKLEEQSIYTAGKKSC